MAKPLYGKFTTFGQWLCWSIPVADVSCIILPAKHVRKFIAKELGVIKKIKHSSDSWHPGSAYFPLVQQGNRGVIALAPDEFACLQERLWGYYARL